jgi:hypothetical protein
MDDSVWDATIFTKNCGRLLKATSRFARRRETKAAIAEHFGGYTF